MANLSVQKYQYGDKEVHLLATYDGMPVSQEQFDSYKRSIGITQKQQQQISMVKLGERMINIASLKHDMQLGTAMVLSKYNLTEQELDELLKLKTRKRTKSSGEESSKQ